MLDHVGQPLGNYRLIRLLGSGGFANVFLGEHVYLNRQAAIKILQARLTQNALEVFLNEARTIASLTHRNIVQVLEFGVEKDIPFLVMSYAPNGTLRHRHPNQSRPSLTEVVSYIRQVADALQYAHDRNVIHRDIKPENMLVGLNDDVLLSDFGIAVVAQSSRYGGQEVGGTVAYMSPEQLQGRASPASDQYALAVVAYEWLAGELPFKGTFGEIGSQHIFTPPPPLRGKIPSLPLSVEQILQTALNKNPQQRFQSVQTFATALAQAIEVNAGLGTAMNIATQASEAQISTVVKQSPPGYPLSGNNFSNIHPAYNNALQHQGYSQVPPPPPGFSMFEYNGNGNTPGFSNTGMASKESPPQDFPVGSEQPKKHGGNRGLIFTLTALVVILVAFTSAGAYFFASKQPFSISPGGQIQPTATSAQPTVLTSPTSITTSIASPTIQDTATMDTTTPTVPTTSPWGPGTKNQSLNCISNCTGNVNSYDVVLTNIAINTSLGTMAWNFAITDRGSVCTALYGKISLIDPTGTSIDADGGTFIQSSSIDSGQMLPKTATFVTLPKPGVQYEVHIDAGCYANSTYEPQLFQR
jgi:serine/threonine protein kinase